MTEEKGQGMRSAHFGSDLESGENFFVRIGRNTLKSHVLKK